MKSLQEMLYASLNEACENCGVGTFKKETEEEEAERVKAIRMGCESEEEEIENASIKDETSFRDYAKNKFKVVFGDNLDEDKMKKTIDGILDDNKEMVENNDWGSLIGILNKSFGA